MTNVFAELKVNPFEDDVVTEPRRVSFSVEGLNTQPLEQLIAKFNELTVGALPRKPVVDQKAQLIVSPDRGYGKSHLIGRLFQALGEQATLIYLRPFQDPQRVWTSILWSTVQELERPNQGGVGSQLEAFSRGVLAHVTADHMSNGPVSYNSRVQDAVKYLRANPLNMSEQTSRSKVLINWMKGKLDDQAELLKLVQLLKSRGVELEGRGTAWLKVLAGYAFTGLDSREREVALKWLRADPLEDQEINVLQLTQADNEGRGDSSAQEINELSLRRLRSLSALASYYRPFVFCFDQTEFYGGNKSLVIALGKCIWELHASFFNHLTIVTTNANNWTADILPLMEPAYQNRFSREIRLEGITPEQAKELIGRRLQEFQINDTAVLSFVGDDWLGAQFSGLRQIGVRDLLIAAAERFRALEKPSAKPRPKTPLADLFKIEVNKIRANHALHQYSQDCLMWFAQALAEEYRAVIIRKTDERYFTVQWAWPDRSIYFAFEGGDHHARWGAIAREAIALSTLAEHFGAVVFRTPDLKFIPRATWGAAKAQINDAQKMGLRVVPLSLDEVCELHAARELYSNALQGNIIYEAAEVLQWLKIHFDSWFNRYSQSTTEERNSKKPPPVAQTRKNQERPAPPLEEADLTEVQLGAVLACVSQRKLVDINEVLRTIGDGSSKTAVLRAIERSPNVKAHPGPQTIYLQWRVVA